MYTVIETTYIGPSIDKRGRYTEARVRARTKVFYPEEKYVSHSEPYDLGVHVDTNHMHAAYALACKLGRTGTYKGGERLDGKGNVYVRITEVAGGCESYPEASFAVGHAEVTRA